MFSLAEQKALSKIIEVLNGPIESVRELAIVRFFEKEGIKKQFKLFFRDGLEALGETPSNQWDVPTDRLVWFLEKGLPANWKDLITDDLLLNRIPKKDWSKFRDSEWVKKNSNEKVESMSQSNMSTEARELLLFIENDASLYEKSKPLIARLKKLKQVEKYSWMMWVGIVREGALKYCKAHADAKQCNQIFPISVQDEVSKALFEHYKGEVDLGNYGEKSPVKASGQKKIAEYELLHHGVDGSQYFQGCGVSGTDFDDCYTGIGNSPKEAFEDALDMLAQDYEISQDLEQDVQGESAVDEVEIEVSKYRPAQVWTVTHFSYSMGSPFVEEKFEDEGEALEYVQNRTAMLSGKGFEISEIEPGKAWEVTESDEFAMVPRESGTISIENNQEELDEFERNQEFNELHYFASIRVQAQDDQEASAGPEAVQSLFSVEAAKKKPNAKAKKAKSSKKSKKLKKAQKVSWKMDSHPHKLFKAPKKVLAASSDAVMVTVKDQNGNVLQTMGGAEFMQALEMPKNSSLQDAIKKYNDSHSEKAEITIKGIDAALSAKQTIDSPEGKIEFVEKQGDVIGSIDGHEYVFIQEANLEDLDIARLTEWIENTYYDSKPPYEVAHFYGHKWKKSAESATSSAPVHSSLEEDEVIEALVQKFGKPLPVASTDEQKAEIQEHNDEIRQEIKDSLELDGVRGTFKADGDSWVVYESDDDSRDAAIEQVKDSIESDPETFSPDFLMRFISLTPTDARMLAIDLAEHVNDQSDRDIIRQMDPDLVERMESDEVAEDEKEKILRQTRERILDEEVERIETELKKDPVGYVVQEGLWTEEQVMKDAVQNKLFGIDVDEAAEAAVQADGWEHFLSHENGDSITLGNGMVIFRD